MVMSNEARKLAVATAVGQNAVPAAFPLAGVSTSAEPE
jgi:hypothetical protein